MPERRERVGRVGSEMSDTFGRGFWNMGSTFGRFLPTSLASPCLC